VLLALAAQAVPLAFARDVTQNRASFLTWAALGLTRLLPIALMLTMTAEWSQRTALTTFTLEPRRGRVLAARIVVGLALSVIGGCGIGIAIGSAVHNTAAAIVTYFALAAVTSLLLIPAVQKAGSWVDTSQTFGWMLAGQWSGHGPQIASSAAIWILAPLAIGTVRTIRRDVR
jgi:hypothetical protein